MDNWKLLQKTQQINVILLSLGSTIYMQIYLLIIQKDVSAEIFNAVKKHSAYWNGASCSAALICYLLYGIAVFNEHDWSLIFIGILFVEITAARTIFACVLYTCDG